MKFTNYIFLLLSCFSTLSHSQDLDESFFNHVKWDNLCPRVLPVELNNNLLQCSISHPASSLQNIESLTLISETMPDDINCDYLESEYKKLVTPMQNNPGKEWQLCFATFYSSYFDRILSPQSYPDSLESWKRTYFNDETMQ